MATRRRSALVVDRATLARVLGTSARTLQRAEAEGLIVPLSKPRRGVVSRYDLTAAVPRWIEHRAKPPESDESPRDAYYRAQAALAELRLLRERREVLPRQEVIEDGQATVNALVATLRALAPRLVQAGAIAEAAVPEVDGVVHEVLAEVANWRTRVELLAAVADDEAGS